MGLSSGMIEANTPSARVHYIAGYVFLSVPDIFFLYRKLTGSQRERKNIQALFERACIHKIREGERFFSVRLYSLPEKTGNYKTVSGYLVKGRYLYGYNKVPEDSAFIIFP